MSTKREAPRSAPGLASFDSMVDLSRTLASSDGQAIEGYVRALVACGISPTDIELVIRQETTADAITHVYSVRPRSVEAVR